MGLAMIMRWALVGRGAVRTAILPYGIVTVVAAYSWQYAWTPGTGYLANLLPSGGAPLTEQWPAIFIIIAAEIWKTTPFMALLLLAGLSLVPEELLKAARVDASAWQRFTQVILPLMKPAILVALLFRTLDAFRIFDNIFILTAGANNTRSVSILGYDNLFTALNLGSAPPSRCWSSSRWRSSPSSSSRASARPRPARRWNADEHSNHRQGVLGGREHHRRRRGAGAGPVAGLAVVQGPQHHRRRQLHPQKWTLANYRGIFQTSLFTGRWSTPSASPSSPPSWPWRSARWPPTPSPGCGSRASRCWSR